MQSEGGHAERVEIAKEMRLHLHWTGEVFGGDGPGLAFTGPKRESPPFPEYNPLGMVTSCLILRIPVLP